MGLFFNFAYITEFMCAHFLLLFLFFSVHLWLCYRFFLGLNIWWKSFAEGGRDRELIGTHLLHCCHLSVDWFAFFAYVWAEFSLSSSICKTSVFSHRFDVFTRFEHWQLFFSLSLYVKLKSRSHKTTNPFSNNNQNNCDISPSIKLFKFMGGMEQHV